MKKHFILIILFILSIIGNSQIKDTLGTKEKNILTSGFLLLESDNSIEAEKYFREHLNTLNSSKEKRKTCYYIALKYNNKLFFDLSISYALEGINEKSEDDYLLKQLCQVIAINHIDLNNYQLAEEYFTNSLKYLIPENGITPNDNNLIGEITRLKGECEKSLGYFHQAISKNKLMSDDNALLMNYNNIGLAHLELNDFDSAQFYLNSSLQKIDSLNLKIRKDAISISFGKLYFKLKDYQRALEYFSNIPKLDLSNHPDKTELYRDAYEGIWQCEEKLGNLELAFEAYKDYQFYNSKILDYTKQALIFQNQIMIERSAYDSELTLLSEQLKLEKRFKNLMFLLFGGIILLVLLILYALWLRNKSIKQKVEIEINRNRIQDLELEKITLSRNRLQSEIVQNEQEKIIKELENKNLERQIDAKNRELTSTAIHLLNKNEILIDIKEKIDLEVKQAPSDISKTLARITYLIKDNLQLDNDWVVFKKHFTEVHPNFFTNLIHRFPELTTDELKLCAYLKIQLSSKEIARLLNVTVTAINKRRNRLRKKLGINPAVDLYEFLLTIDS